MKPYSISKHSRLNKPIEKHGLSTTANSGWKRLLFAICLLVVGARMASAQPVINSLYPPTLTERVGDHVAFTVSATGSGTLSYQWYQNGGLLAGQTNAWIVLTNIQTSSSGQYGVTVTDSTSEYASNSATLNVSSSYLPLYSTNLVVLRLGDGVQTLTASNGNTIYLDQYSTNGNYVSTIQIPDNLPGKPYGVGTNVSVPGSQSVILPGIGTDAANQGVVTLSGNQQFLTFGGYLLAYPFAGTDVTTYSGSSFIRGIYSVNAFGYPSLVYTNYGLYNGGNHTLRSAVTLDDTNFWTAGEAGANGLKYLNATVASSTVPAITSSSTGVHVAQIFNGNLVYSETNGLDYTNLSAAEIVYGLTGKAAANFIKQTEHPNDFAISPDGNTVYIADGSIFTNGVQSGGIQRWDSTGNGGFAQGYQYSYTVAPTAGTNGAQNLTVYFPPNISTWGANATGAIIYATPTGVTNNSIVSIVDNGNASTATPFITAGPNQVLRGLRFSPPTVAAPSIAAQPQSVTNALGNTTTFSVTPAGSAPFFYQWQFNGANIVDATNAILTLTDVQFANAGNYSVIVSNLTTSVATSSNALLTVVQGAPGITAQPQSRQESVGDHLALAVQLTGSLPISYQWFYNNSPLPGATNSALVFSNVATSDAGTYYLQATNVYGATNSVSVSLNVTTGLQFLSSTNLVVARVGDGSQALSGATGNTIYLDQYTTNGTYVGSIQIPDQGAGLPYGYGGGTNVSESVNLPPGSQPIIVAGAGADAPYEALLTLSADSASLNFAGYLQAYPYNGSDVSYSDEDSSGGSLINWRAIGGVSAYGYYTLNYTNSGLYSGGNHTIHSATTLEGVNFWSAGEAGSDGIKFLSTQDASYANGAGIPVVTSSGPGPRVVQILNGNVVFTDASASPPGIYYAGASTETKGSTDLSTLYLTENGSPVDFAVSPDGQTIYISDDEAFAGSSTQAGGIQRWDASSPGVFGYSYTLATGTNAAGATGLTVYFPPNITSWGSGVEGAVLFATTAERPNRLISVVDNGANSIATTLADSGANQAFAGIRFGPSLVGVNLYSNPQSTNVLAGENVSLSVVPTGSAPYYYQWELNGTAISGATNATLTLSDVQPGEAGAYTVAVSNNVDSTISSAGQLTVATGVPQFLSETNLGVGQGFQLNFTGPAGFGYSIWSSTNLDLQPVESTWKKVTTGSSFSGNTDSYIDPSGGTNAAEFYIITVP